MSKQIYSAWLDWPVGQGVFANIYATDWENTFAEFAEVFDLEDLRDDILDQFNELTERFDRLAHGEAPSQDSRNGHRKYLWEFFELISTDQIDGYKQQMQFFSNALGEKINGLDSDSSTGIIISNANPVRPRIVQNRPKWVDIQLKPEAFPPAEHSHGPSDFPDLSLEINSKIPLTQKGASNGVASLDGTGKVPASQIPVFNPTLQIVNTIGERNALSPTGNLPVYVKNATADSTVLTGGAFYLYELASGTWVKLSEMESMDIIQSWVNIIDKPEYFPSNIENIVGLQTALNSKRAIGDIPALEITESVSRRFVSDSEKTLWNNTIHNAGNISGSQSFAGFNSNRTYKATLIDNTTFAEISGGVEGNVYVMVFLQDSTGGRTISFPTNVKIPTGEAPDLGANKKSILTMYFDGTNYLGSWKKGWS
ncbi:hypothetical protein [Leptospira bandrabouensis]|uniref:hypothetical protein n=1 Tax=Leptospira bandrabouensis TaxID=2484903 RepID=UPI001EE83EA2|nr:hypothetical protein [Leptospira bandrabouensis]MCG6144116.1 hypothetical protein [Leptospira bandrabouensis]MCG6159777.1 hypothetical protein [Leptospira bandrabouensis]MCG6163710.1 hypothetical protein [Leptospira bandrabouensis]